MENQQNGPEFQEVYDPADIQKNKVFAALAYLWILFFLPLVACPESRFGRFHANQALVLFIFSTAGSIVLACIPIIGWLLIPVYEILMLIELIFGIVNAANGNAKDLPVIGKIRIIK